MGTRRVAAMGAAGLAVAAGGGAAVAATGGQAANQREAAVLNDAAGRLGVTPDRLRAALAAAQDAQLDAAVRRGEPTADAIKILDEVVERVDDFPGRSFGRGFGFGFGLGAPSSAPWPRRSA